MTLTLGSMLLACSSNSNVLSVLPSSTNTNSQSKEGQPLRVADKASCIAETLAASLYTGMTTEISGRVCFLFSLKAMKPRGERKRLLARQRSTATVLADKG